MLLTAASVTIDDNITNEKRRKTPKSEDVAFRCPHELEIVLPAQHA